MDMKKALILLLFFAFSVCSFAEEFHYRTLGCTQGLSQPSAISIWQDRLGRMWFGNDVLNCYSGENTQIYRLSEYFKEIEDANIHGICGTDSVLYHMLKSNMNTLHIPVILLTGQPSAEQKKESVRCGSDDYIVKPFDMEMLFLRCNSLVRVRKSILRKYTKQENAEIDDMATNIQDQEFLKAVNRVIEENWNNNSFDTNFWSRELGIGRTRLFIQLKRVTGMTPNEYVLSMKMNRSRCLLEGNSLTIAEVAYQIGFSNPAYFSKCFKKQFGITPQEYKRKRSEGFSVPSE